MKLSVLIPAFNDDCSALVQSLHEVCSRWGETFEIIIGDDASTDQTVLRQLKQTTELKGVRLIRQPENVGRARIRNLLAEQAQGDWLLFVDSDAAVPEDFSPQRFIEASQQAKVVCGGLRHPAENPNPAATLRYKYERKADRRRAACFRAEHPYLHFTPFNLWIDRETFLKVRFDEQCREYGYEDVLFGAELERRKIPILHIDNPLIHIGLEENSVFLDKTETALRTLKDVAGKTQRHSHVENLASRLRRHHLSGVVCGLYRLLRKPLRCNLLGKHPSLKLLAFYKLGYYLDLKDTPVTP